MIVPGEVSAKNKDSAANADGDDFAIATAVATQTVELGEMQRLMLLVSVNGRARGIVPVQRKNSEFWVARDDLPTLGIKVPNNPAQLVQLSTLQGAITQYDDAKQSLDLTVPVALLDAEISYLNRSENLVLDASPSPGLLVNYDAAFNYVDGQAQLGLFSELRAFSSAGTFETTAITRWDINGLEAVRFDTSYTRSFPSRRQQLRIGDVITSSTQWSRPIRLGGVRFGTDFSLQPNFVTTPIQQSFGSAALPSRLELFVNGSRRFAGDVEPGPFVVDLGPNRFEGPGEAQVVLTDMLGRSSVQNLNFYNSPRLLRAGLNEWSAELGFARKDYGFRSFAYDNDLTGNVSWRQGLTDRFTLEAHAEARSGLFSAGVGQTMSLDQFGVVASSISRSVSDAGSGERVTISYDWSNGFFNVSGELSRSWGRFVDLGSNSELALAPPDSEFVQIGLSDASLGTLTANYGRLAYANGSNLRYAGLAWRKQISPRMALRFSYRHGFNNNVGSGVFLSLDMTLPNQTFSSVGYGQVDGDDNFSLRSQRSAPLEGGIGWQVALQRQVGGTSALGRVEAIGRSGQLSATLANSFGQWRTNASLRGSLIYMAGDLFTARTIDDSFALVTADGLPDVPVTLNNRRVGLTNASGQLLVPRLQSWQANHIGIDTADLPPWISVDTAASQAIPADRTGTRVSFSLNRLRAVSMRVVDTAGEYLPAGSRATIHGSPDAELLLGFDGMLYIEEPLAGALIRVETPSGTCSWRLPARIELDGIKSLGRQICGPETHHAKIAYANLGLGEELLTIANRICQRPQPFVSPDDEDAAGPMICKEEA
jgi:outer membrane usher protein